MREMITSHSSFFKTNLISVGESGMSKWAKPSDSEKVLQLGMTTGGRAGFEDLVNLLSITDHIWH